MNIPFLKMHSLGNDFIILDTRKQDIQPLGLNLAKLADRHLGIGCDQIIFLSEDKTASIHMRIINADGSEVEACGNATRCIGWLMMEENQSLLCSIRTQAGLLQCTRESPESTIISAAMTIPTWRQTTLEGSPVAVNVGNPHLVFFVDNVNAIALEEIGPEWENHPDFPQRTNVEFVECISPSHLKMRVWERGVGITQACGTGACASQIAAHILGKAADTATVEMPGGSLTISWDGQPKSHVVMTGPVSFSFQGIFPLKEYHS